MNAAEQIKKLNVEDPLYARFKKPEPKVEAKPASDAKPEIQTKTSSKRWLLLAALILAVAGLVYYLAESQKRVDQLSASLAQSQSQLTTVTEQLQSSGEKIDGLQQDLSQSQSHLKMQERKLTQHKNLYSELKTGQEQQTRDLQIITVQKADQAQVDSLKDNLQTVDSKVGQANSNISDLREQTTRNRSDLDSTRQELSSVKQATDTNAGQISEVKRSLEREVYNFELHEKGGVMKVLNVALSLRDINFDKQRFDLEIIANGKRIKKNDQHVNEPIYFYVEGVKKPYEILIVKVDKKFVTGHLSVPKA